MAKKINTTLPIRFFDDRGKEKEKLVLDKILFEDEHNCLCTTKNEWHTKGEEKILFKKSDGTVLTENFSCWCAENFETDEIKAANKAIKYAKDRYVDKNSNIPCLLLGDIAGLITEMTGVEVNMEDITNFTK